MADIKHIENVEISGQEIHLLIKRISGIWSCEPIKGNTGTGIMSGGKYETLEDYINNCVTQHRYSYNFFNHGYKAAKESIS